MSGHYPYAMVALLLIYPHSTTQDFWFNTNKEHVGKLLREENTAIDGTQVDIACDLLTPEEKWKLCADTMEQAIIFEHKIKETPGHFTLAKAKYAVPQLVDPNNQHKCKPIRIEGLDIEKRMYWCPHRVYKHRYSGEIQAEGFFVSSGLITLNRAFLFRSPSPNSETVVPFAKMELVDVLAGRVHEATLLSGRASMTTPLPSFIQTS